jgi:hypothetical protein
MLTKAWRSFDQLAGASYLEVHKAGGGIHFTVRHVRAATEDQLYAAFKSYARRMIEAGRLKFPSSDWCAYELPSVQKPTSVLRLLLDYFLIALKRLVIEIIAEIPMFIA